MSVFDPVERQLDFPRKEAEIRAFWKSADIFHKSLKASEGKTPWVFFEGPPTANGKPHPGHVLTRVVKDLFPRYKTMTGHSVPRKAGWDTHGLPVEIEVEKELKLDGKTEVEKYGVEPFVRKCMDSVFRYTNDWETLTEKIGFWIDLKEAYVTYHQSYVESVWWSLAELHKRGLLYRGFKILPWCPHCQTALSSHEVGQGYKEVEDPAIFVTFRTDDWETSKTSFLAWTTTPWTLPGNSGLAVKADTEYSFVSVGEETLIMASALVKSVMGKLKYEITKTEPGSALIGRKYRPLFNWADSVLSAQEKAGAWKVCAGDFVTLDTGSGIVHIAPAFGADDYNLGRREGLPVIQLVGPDGKFSPACGDFAGRFVKEADNDIIRDLKTRGLLLKRENYKHDYPFCWRCKSPLIYYARGGWFIRTTQEISHVIENNQKVDWHPEHIKDGRFGSFLESNIDWALSRERYWGTPLPVWRCEDDGTEEAISSLAELASKPGVEGLDHFDKAKLADPTLNSHLRVHKPWIDSVTYLSPKGGKMRRVTEVIDCWYDSGAMPFAQWGYPHLPGSKENFNRAFPADFISEAIDQTRGWFYSLIAESTLLRESFAAASGKRADYPLPYKTCLVLGHVCDEKGEKMSKSKGNYLDPNLILDEEGADALRWFFYSSTNPWTSARFSRPAVRDSQKEFLIKLRNVYSFFVIYANIDDYAPDCESGMRCNRGGVTPLDSWILSELNLAIQKTRERLDGYDIFGASQVINEFVESLSNWYVRRSRDRFWGSGMTPTKAAAYNTLYECLVTLSKLIAPFVPFMAEELWQNLARKPLGDKVPESVHLCDYPEANAAVINHELATEVALVREIASTGRAARSDAKLKTRQPLSKVFVVLNDAKQDSIVRQHQETVKSELNVKAVEIVREAGIEEFVTRDLKPNFKAIGTKFRDKVPQIKAKLAQKDYTLDGVNVLLNMSPDAPLQLTPEEVEVALKAKPGFAAASGKGVVVILDTQLTPDLEREGLARELISHINGMRAELNLAYEQRIKLAIAAPARIVDAAKQFAESIQSETLAEEIVTTQIPDGYRRTDVEIEGEAVALGIATI